MKKLRLRTLFATITVCVLISALALFLSFARQMKRKSEWSVLQQLEYSSRLSSNDTAVVFGLAGGYEAIGIRSTSGRDVYPSPKYPRVWLLVTPKYGEKVKKIPPDADYVITTSDLNLILSHVPNISSETKSELQHHLRN